MQSQGYEVLIKWKQQRPGSVADECVEFADTSVLAADNQLVFTEPRRQTVRGRLTVSQLSLQRRDPHVPVTNHGISLHQLLLQSALARRRLSDVCLQPTQQQQRPFNGL